MMNDLYFASAISLLMFIVPSIVLWVPIKAHGDYKIPLSVQEVMQFYQGTLFLTTISVLWLGVHSSLIILWVMKIIPELTTPAFVLCILWGSVVGTYVLVWIEQRKTISRSVAIIRKRYGEDVRLNDYLQFTGKTLPINRKARIAMLVELARHANSTNSDYLNEVGTQLARAIHTVMNERLDSLNSTDDLITDDILAFFRVEYPAGIATEFNRERFVLFEKYLGYFTDAVDGEKKLVLSDFVFNLLDGTPAQQHVAVGYHALMYERGLVEKYTR